MSHHPLCFLPSASCPERPSPTRCTRTYLSSLLVLLTRALLPPTAERPPPRCVWLHLTALRTLPTGPPSPSIHLPPAECPLDGRLERVPASLRGSWTPLGLGIHPPARWLVVSQCAPSPSRGGWDWAGGLSCQGHDAVACKPSRAPRPCGHHVAPCNGMWTAAPCGVRQDM